MYVAEFADNKIVLKNAENFDLSQTLDCGQAFRWKVDENGRWSGIAKDRMITLYRQENNIIIENATKVEYFNIWKDYFDLDRNYAEIISSVSKDTTIREAARFSEGIRILNQDPWETLCSFIISQNNNIPRIKGIIDRLCQNFGKKIGDGYTFPAAENIASLTVDDLSPLRSGFRAKYILDAAKKVADGEINFDELKSVGYAAAKEKLMIIKGVGPKVADCVALFGLGYIEAFPQDVWIKRAMAEMFNGNLPECAKGYEGIVQQYIFYYIRLNETKDK